MTAPARTSAEVLRTRIKAHRTALQPHSGRAALIQELIERAEAVDRTEGPMLGILAWELERVHVLVEAVERLADAAGRDLPEDLLADLNAVNVRLGLANVAIALAKLDGAEADGLLQRAAEMVIDEHEGPVRPSEVRSRLEQAVTLSVDELFSEGGLLHEVSGIERLREAVLGTTEQTG